MFQGIILNYFLFIICLNELINQNIDREILYFTNDTVIIFISNCINDNENKVNVDLFEVRFTSNKFW